MPRQVEVWSDAKLQRAYTLLLSETIEGTCARLAEEFGGALYEEFGVRHNQHTINRKARTLGVAVPHPKKDVDAAAREAIGHDCSFSTMKAVVASCYPTLKALYAHCQFPIGEPREPGFRFCGDAVPLGQPYCDAHHRICYIQKSYLQDVSKTFV